MNSAPYASILLFGAPGAGKGTHGKVLGGLPGFFHLSSGDIFRSLDPGSDDGRAVAEYSSQGQLVPDELTIRIWETWLRGQVDSGGYDPAADMLLLDGIPRTVAQCEILEEHVDVRLVLHLASTDDEPLVQRILGRGEIEGRSDDSDVAIVRNRFEVYRRESSPVIEHYPAERRADVDPLGTPAEVLARVLEHVIPVQQAFLAATN